MTSRRAARIGVVLGAIAGSAACAARDRAPVVRNVGVPGADSLALAKRADELLAASEALDYERPFRGQPRDLAPVIAAYLDACGAGDGRSCRRAMALEHQAGRDSGAGGRALLDGCRAGQVDSCRALTAGMVSTENHGLAGWAGRAPSCKHPGCEVELRGECSAGFAASCAVLAGQDVADDDALFARARALARVGCRAEIGPDCQVLGELRETDDDHRLRLGYRCHLLGVDCTSYGLELHADPVAARDVFERACQYDQAHQVDACKVLVESYQDQRFPEPLPGRARAIHDWVCAQPNPWRDFCAPPARLPAAPGG